MKLRESSQLAIAAVLDSIAPSVLLSLNNNVEFEEASRGSCLVTLVDCMLKLAANGMRDPRKDQREAQSELLTVVMEGKGFYEWKHLFDVHTLIAN